MCVQTEVLINLDFYKYILCMPTITAKQKPIVDMQKDKDKGI